MRIQNSEFRIQIARALIALALLTGAARAAHAELIERVLAVVAGQPITLSDVVGARDLGFQSADGASDPMRAILSKLIDRELMLAETDRYGPPEPTTEAVDRDVARVRARFASQAEFDAAVARSGIDAQHLRETVRQNLRIAAYLDQRFTAAGERRQALIDDWVAGLRRRGNVLDLYLPGR
ncbi:MAG: SurA N-terminal domain-containing protein [Acidobacteriia bacterium]|nr:SurA N-terminal domain-containing protein [Terriglobia bacterium]